MVNIQLEDQEAYLVASLLDVARENLANKFKKALGLPVSFKEDNSFENVAKLLMREIMFENGMVNRWETELDKYTEKWVGMIEEACEKFFTANPDKLTEDDILLIALLPDYNELEEFVGGKELNEVLDHWFDHYPEEDGLRGDWIEDYIFSEPISRCTKCGKVVHKGQKKFCECDKIVKE